MFCNSIKTVLFIVLLNLGLCDLRAQDLSDTAAIDTVSISAGSLSFTKSAVFVSRDLIEKTILPLSSTNITHLLAYVPFVSRSQEMSSGINIKGSGLYTSRFYLDGLPLRPINHNYGFFSGYNAQTIDNVNIYDGYVPSSYNSGGGIASFSLLKPLSTKNTLSLLTNPYNAVLFSNLKFNKNHGLMASYCNSYSAALMQKQYPDLINQYEDLFLRSQHKFAKDYGELSLYFYNFKERQNAKSSIGFQNASKGAMENRDLGFTMKLGNKQSQWRHDISGIGVQERINLDLGYSSVVQNEKSVWLQYRLENQAVPAMPKFLAETEIVDYQLDDSVITYRLKNSLYSVALYDDWTFGKLNIKMDARLNYLNVRGANKFTPIYRAEGTYNTENSKIILSSNRFVQNRIGLANNLFPIYQDLKIPLLTTNRVPITYDFNLKYLHISKKLNYQFMLNYSSTENAVDYRSVYSNIYNINSLTYGRSRYYGAGLAVTYKIRRFSINSNLTYSRSMNFFDSVNWGVPYQSNHNRPIIFNTLLNTNIGKVPISLQFTAQSGRPITRPVGFLGYGIIDWSYRNEFRTRAFHHLDIGAVILNKQINKELSHKLNFHFYNVYMRRNVYNEIYKDNQFKELSLFPVLISLEYQIKLTGK
jgi:hypothetical protein